jgi:hypothetical protein
MCHQSELSLLERLSGYDYFWQVNCEPLSYLPHCAYRPIGSSVKTFSYEAYPTQWSVAFASLPPESRQLWLFVALCHAWFSAGGSDEGALADDAPSPMVSIYALFSRRHAPDAAASRPPQALSDLHGRVAAALDGEDPVQAFLGGPAGAEGELPREAFRLGVLLLALAASMLAPDVESEQDQLLEFVEETTLEYRVLTGEPDLGRGGSLFTVVEVRGEPAIVFYRQSEICWNVFSFERDVVRSLWATEATNCLFWGNDDAERPLIQADHAELHNLIVQLSDVPSDYPAFVSQIEVSDGNRRELFV